MQQPITPGLSAGRQSSGRQPAGLSRHIVTGVGGVGKPLDRCCLGSSFTQGLGSPAETSKHPAELCHHLLLQLLSQLLTIELAASALLWPRLSAGWSTLCSYNQAKGATAKAGMYTAPLSWSGSSMLASHILTFARVPQPLAPP